MLTGQTFVKTVASHDRLYLPRHRGAFAESWTVMTDSRSMPFLL